MASIEIDVGPFPEAARSVILDYRERGGTTNYIRLGETTDRISRWDVPPDTLILVRARFRGRTRIGPPTDDVPYDTRQQIQNRPDPATDLTVPEAVVTQDGPALAVTVEAPVASDAGEYEVEAVQCGPLIVAAENVRTGLHLGFAEPGEPIPASAWPGGQAIATRLVRKEDDARTPWAFQSVPTAEAIVDPALGHSNDFASGDIGLAGNAASNPASMEVSGGDLRHKDIYAGDIAAYAGDLTEVYAGDMGLRWPGRYTAAEVELPAAESLQFQWMPSLTSTTRPTFYAGDWWQYAGGPPLFSEDGIPRDRRVHLNCMTAGAIDDIPMEIQAYVATTDTAPASFADGDFEPLVPGKVYPDVLIYQIRFDIGTTFDKRLTIDQLYVWHWIWCRARPWHTHSWAPELIYESTAGSDLASLTATVALEDWDEVRVEVDWKNADASPSQLFVRFNNDSGNNYYREGAAAASSLLLGGGTLAAGAWEFAAFTIRNPKSGLERRVRVETGQRSHATDSLAAPAAASAMWDNTADAITSIVFDATVGATPLGQDSTFRIWGKRRIG